MKNITNNAFVESVIMIIISTVLILISLYVPFFLVVGIFLCGVPLALIAVKHSVKTTAIAALVLLLVLCIMTAAPLSSIVLLLLMVMPGIVSGLCIKNNKGFFLTLVLVILSIIAAFMVNVQIMNIAYGDNSVLKIITEYANTFEKVLKSRLDVLASSNAELLEGIDIETYIKQISTQIVNMFTLYFPAMIIIMALVIGYCSLKVNAFFIKKFKVKEYKNNIPFMYLTVPKSVVYIMFILDLFIMFADSSGDNSLIASAFLNMESILSFIVIISGLAFVEFHFCRFLPQRWIRVIVYVAVFIFGGAFMSILTYVIKLVGIFDILLGYRRYLINQNMGS